MKCGFVGELAAALAWVENRGDAGVVLRVREDGQYAVWESVEPVGFMSKAQVAWQRGGFGCGVVDQRPLREWCGVEGQLRVKERACRKQQIDARLAQVQQILAQTQLELAKSRDREVVVMETLRVVEEQRQSAVWKEQCLEKKSSAGAAK